MRSLLCGVLVPGALVALVFGCGPADRSLRDQRASDSARQVRTVRPEMRPMARRIAATGTLAADEKSILSAKVAGRLQPFPVDLGSTVNEGDLLAQIEPRDYELGLQQAAAALAQARTALGLLPEAEADTLELDQVSAVRQAKAVLEEATANRERVKSLTTSGIAAQSELDTAESAYKVAISRRDAALEDARARIATVAQRRAEFELARKHLADASVRAPFHGAVQARLAHVGEYVAPDTPILELVKTDPLRLRLQVPERESSMVREGQAVRLFVEGDTNSYAGQVARLSPALDEQNRMLMVEADVPRRGSLRPGLFARAEIVVAEHEEGLSVPAAALVTFAGIEKVVVASAGKALEKVVATGRRGPDWVEIVSGLDPGDEVILNPGGMRTGETVRPQGTAVAAPHKASPGQPGT